MTWNARTQSLLLDWFAREGRILLWRSPTVTPYEVLVSEVMLQQTQVARVAPHFQAFISTYPDVGAKI